jgi:hypothetical protein
MFKLRNPFKRSREDQALVNIVAVMQSEEELMWASLQAQVEQKLLAMSPVEREKAIRVLKGE